MGLRDISALQEGRIRTNPTPEIWAIVNTWVAGLDSAPWQSPSTPFPELSFFGEVETRSAVVPNSCGIEVFYRHEYASDDIEIIWVH